MAKEMFGSGENTGAALAKKAASGDSFLLSKGTRAPIRCLL